MTVGKATGGLALSNTPFAVGKKTTLFVQGIFLAALLCGTGVAIYYARCIKTQTSNLLMQSSQFYAENSALREQREQMARMEGDSPRRPVINAESGR